MLTKQPYLKVALAKDEAPDAPSAAPLSGVLLASDILLSLCIHSSKKIKSIVMMMIIPFNFEDKENASRQIRKVRMVLIVFHAFDEKEIE